MAEQVSPYTGDSPSPTSSCQYNPHQPYITVYILETDNYSRSEDLRHLFEESIFAVNIVEISVPPNIYPKLKREDAEDLYRIKWCLNDARDKNLDEHIIIIKDTSITNASSQDIAQIIAYTQRMGCWDICYLCKWMDRCDLYTDKINIPGHSIAVTKAYSPDGCQALFLSPRGRDIVLGHYPLINGDYLDIGSDPKLSLSIILSKAIKDDQLQAVCLVPNLFNINTANINSDTNKFRECLHDTITNNGSNNSNSTSTSTNGSNTSTPSANTARCWWGWLIFLVFFFLIIVLIFAFLNSNTRKDRC